MTNATFARVQAVLSLLLGCLLLRAGPASAQTATSTFSVSSSGTIGTPTSPLIVARPGAPENINCTGTVKLVTTAVTDPTLPPGVVVRMDARGLSCVGATSKIAYLNTGFASITRLLVANDVVKMTFALYPNTAGGFMKARTGMVTANLTYNTTTGALTGASLTIGNFQ
jgi:hypothetical protein